MFLFVGGLLWLVEMKVDLQLGSDLPLPPELDLLRQVSRIQGKLTAPSPATSYRRTSVNKCPLERATTLEIASNSS